MNDTRDDLQNRVTVVVGDLLDQRVDAIVNAWNRNVIPWWLLLPQGVSGAIKKRAGLKPFRELGRMGPIPLGGAVVTSAGRLSFRAIIHVAGINLLWRASETSIRASVASALSVANNESFGSIAIPAIGAGSGGFGEEESLRLIEDEITQHPLSIDVTLVRYRGSRI
ncbi:MAG: Appr-1-p processing protein [Planctomycetaceae bacterium]|nr:Appr-1-p processing protein [Planctomycetaceae bacterium]